MSVSRGKLVIGALACLLLGVGSQASAQMGGGGMAGMGSSKGQGPYFEGQLNLPWDLVEGNTRLRPGTYYVRIEKGTGPSLYLIISKDKRSAPVLRVIGQNLKTLPADNMIKKQSLVLQLREDEASSPSRKAAVFLFLRREGSMGKGEVERWEFKLYVTPAGP